jgi:hypothetical protein
MTDETTTTKKAGLSPIEVGAGAGAAVITAFATSYLGTAGTLTGAALASVVGTLSTSLLRNSAQTSAERLKHTTARLRETGVGHAGATDIRPVESEDIDPYRTQLFRTSDWIDPEARRQVGGEPLPPNGSQRIGTGERNRGLDQDRTTRLGSDSAIGRGSVDPGYRTEPLGTSDSTDRSERSGAGTEVWGPGGLAGVAGSEPGSAWGEPTERLDGYPDHPTEPYRPGERAGGARGPAGHAGAGPGTGSPEPYRPGPVDGARGPSGHTGAGPGPMAPYRPGPAGGAQGPSGHTGAGPGRTEPFASAPFGSIQAGAASGRTREGAGNSRRRWVLLGAGAVAAFAVSLGAITGIEAVAGKPLSGLTGHESGGGTTLGRATGGDTRDRQPTPTPTTGATTTPAPSQGATPSGGVSATTPSGPATQPSQPAPSPSQPSRPAPTQAPSASPNPLTSETP